LRLRLHDGDLMADSPLTSSSRTHVHAACPAAAFSGVHAGTNGA
jgi:hypothetical protein